MWIALARARRRHHGPGQRPGNVADIIIIWNAAVEICAGLLLMIGQLYIYETIPIDNLVSHLILFLRLVSVVWCLATVVIAFSIYQEPGVLTEEQQQDLQKDEMKVVSAGGLMLHAADVWVMQTSGLSEGPLGEGMTWGLCLLVLLDILLVLFASFVPYHRPWPWIHQSPASRRPVGSFATAAAIIDLDGRSRILEIGAEELCSICLCCPGRGETVSTLPCGHTFHRTCVEIWLSKSRTCPFRCPVVGIKHLPPPPLPQQLGSSNEVTDDDSDVASAMSI